MPDGGPYDGRFNLTGDIQFARVFDLEMDVTDSPAMARFYEVPLSDYLRGQDWRRDYPRQREDSLLRLPLEILPAAHRKTR